MQREAKEETVIGSPGDASKPWRTEPGVEDLSRLVDGDPFPGTGL